MLRYISINGLLYEKFAKKYQFDYFVHGSDWKLGTQSNERKKLIEAMKSWGGKVVEFPYTRNISSTILKKRLKKCLVKCQYF